MKNGPNILIFITLLTPLFWGGAKLFRFSFAGDNEGMARMRQLETDENFARTGAAGLWIWGLQVFEREVLSVNAADTLALRRTAEQQPAIGFEVAQMSDWR